MRSFRQRAVLVKEAGETQMRFMPMARCGGLMALSFFCSTARFQRRASLLSTIPGINPNARRADSEGRLLHRKSQTEDTSAEIVREVCAMSDASTCIDKLIRKLGEMTAESRWRHPCHQALILRQEISENVLTVSLQVDGFLAEVDSEVAQIRAVHDDLTNRRDTAVGHSTLGSAIGSGGGAVGAALAIAGNTVATAGNWVAADSGSRCRVRLPGLFPGARPERLLSLRASA